MRADVFAVGYTPELLTAVWMGNSNSEPMRGLSSAMGPGVLWREFMLAGLAHFRITPTWYARPEGIVDAAVCVRPGMTGGIGSGVLPSARCPALTPSPTDTPKPTNTPRPTPTPKRGR